MNERPSHDMILYEIRASVRSVRVSDCCSCSHAVLPKDVIEKVVVIGLVVFSCFLPECTDIY